MMKALGDLLYLNEHLSCNHYVSDYRCCFKYYEAESDTEVEEPQLEYNQLVFLLHGHAVVSCDEFKERIFRSGELAFLPRLANVTARIRRGSVLMVCTFDLPNNPCDKLALESCWELCRGMEYTFDPVKVRPQLRQFLDSLAYYLRNGINCEHLHEIKQKELFLIFKWFYPKEELARLFYPMVGKSVDFKAQVMENYPRAASVEDLARLSGMSRSRFDARFKEVFGMPAGQWMLKQKARYVLHALSLPGTTISDIIFRYGFNSPSQFTRFCRQQFGCTPTRLAAGMRNGEDVAGKNGKDSGKKGNNDNREMS